MARRVLRALQKAGKVMCLSCSPGAAWKKEGNTLERGQREGNRHPAHCELAGLGTCRRISTRQGWHEVKGMADYWLGVDTLTQPMRVWEGAEGS